jgi:hypothetical protein
MWEAWEELGGKGAVVAVANEVARIVCLRFRGNRPCGGLKRVLWLRKTEKDGGASVKRPAELMWISSLLRSFSSVSLKRTSREQYPVLK